MYGNIIFDFDNIGIYLSSGCIHCVINMIVITAMFLSRTLGRTLFAAAARSKQYATTAAAAAGREGHNPLQEFFEADRSPDDDKPVVYGMHYAPLVFIWI